MDHFPLGLATGEAFCDREDERRVLRENFLSGGHTWLMAPRRVGKSSLVEQVLLDVGKARRKVVWTTEDLLLAGSTKALQRYVLDAVGRLTGQILPTGKQTAQSVATVGRFFSNLVVREIVLSGGGPKVRFVPEGDPVQQVRAALEGLDEAAQSLRTRAILVLDEFQQVATLPESQPVEAAIRHAVERAHNVTYVFLGSKQHLLAAMFESASRPLYHLCERLEIGLIPWQKYRAFLRKKAVVRWNEDLSEGALEAILSSTDAHPYYVTRLCRALWRRGVPPRAEEIRATWQAYVEGEHGSLAERIEELTANQRTVLLALTASPTGQPRSQAFVARVQLPHASVGHAVKELLKRELIYKGADGLLMVWDPALRNYLERFAGSDQLD
jgi:hypothetical protein